ncbi:MAG: alpha/beta hydrolase [Burkholderiales bacterium]
MNPAPSTLLEIIRRSPSAHARDIPLLFVHGAFVGAWCWDEYFLPWFAEHGYDARAVSLRGHGGSPVQGSLDLAGLDDYVADTLLAAGQFDSPPILIGHSMGAVVVQRAARRCGAPGMVLMAPVPPHGLAGSLLTLATRDPPLFLALNAMQLGNGHNSPGLRRVRDYLFSQTVSEHDARRHLLRMQRESQRALSDLAWPQHLWMRQSVGLPTLVLGAGRDAFFPGGALEEAARFHGAPPRVFPDMAHAMMLESEWLQVAVAIKTWLAEQGFDSAH